MRKLLAILSLMALPLSACDDVLEALTTATLTVRNLTSTPVVYLYFSDCSAASWRSDRLGPNEVIATGGRRSWSVDAGCWDVRAEFSDDGYAEQRVQLVAGQEFTLSLTE